LQNVSRPWLEGNELFITEAFREHLSKGLQSPDFLGRPPAPDLSDVSLCVGGRSTVQPLRFGGIVSGLPQPRGIPYDALLARSAFPQGDVYDQAVFYTHLERAGLLRTFLSARGFVFSHEELQRMITSSQRFSAIGMLIWVVGGIMIIAAFFFLFTCVVGFMEKNARPNSVLRAYGLTRNMLSRQIMWRLAAVLPYALMVLLIVGLILGVAFQVVFSTIGLPLPSVVDALKICASAIALTLAGTYVVVLLSVWLWWRKHDRIAQELG
jgi:FtsX-like permease family protein